MRVGRREYVASRSRACIAHPCASEIGMASGLYLPGRDTFRILAVQIRAKDGLRELTFRALRALLEAARERYGAHLCEWIYEWPAGKRDPHMA